jgi:hypothetical protein
MVSEANHLTDSAMPYSEIPPAGQDDMGLRCGTANHLTDSAMPYSEIPPAGQDDMALHCGTLTQHLTDSAMPWQRGCSTTRHRQPGNALS